MDRKQQDRVIADELVRIANRLVIANGRPDFWRQIMDGGIYNELIKAGTGSRGEATFYMPESIERFEKNTVPVVQKYLGLMAKEGRKYPDQKKAIGATVSEFRKALDEFRKDGADAIRKMNEADPKKRSRMTYSKKKQMERKLVDLITVAGRLGMKYS